MSKRFSSKFESPTEIPHRYRFAMSSHRITHSLQSRLFSILLRYDIIYRFSPMFRRNQKYLRILHRFTDDMIQRRRDVLLRLETVDQPTDVVDVDGRQPDKPLHNLVDILLHARSSDGRPLSNADIREEVDTFIFEGHDTTTSAITFCLYHIAKYADVQRRCFDECRAIAGDDPHAPLTIGQLRALPYLDAVIRETLRLYPSVPAIGRKIGHETTISEFVCV